MVAIKKSETLTLQIDAETLDMITRAAQLQGRSVTSFVTEAALVSAQNEILDQQVFKVSPEVFDEIEALLAEPPKVNDALVTLFQKKTSWID